MAFSTLDFSSLLENRAALSIKFHTDADNADFVPMASNDHCLLYCPKGRICLMGALGQTYLNIERDFPVSDVCWSCFQSKYLLLSGQTLYSLGAPSTMIQTTKQPLPEHLTEVVDRMKFPNLEVPRICTVSMDTFIVIDTTASVMEFYTMVDWRLVQKYHQPVSCKANQQISNIRFNANGTRLGMVVKDKENPSYSCFELRHPYNMIVLKRIDLSSGTMGYCLVGLPISKDKFLLNEIAAKKFYVIDSYNHIDGDNKVVDTVSYQSDQYMSATTLMNDAPQQWLVVQKADEYSFYNVPRVKQLDLVEL